MGDGHRGTVLREKIGKGGFTKSGRGLSKGNFHMSTRMVPVKTPDSSGCIASTAHAL